MARLRVLVLEVRLEPAAHGRRDPDLLRGGGVGEAAGHRVKGLGRRRPSPSKQLDEEGATESYRRLVRFNSVDRMLPISWYLPFTMVPYRLRL